MKLDYETVYRAVKGNHDAQEKLLQYYDAYISALSTVVEICSDDELMLSILASYAQEESYSASENKKWQMRKDFEQGKVGSMRMLGYRRTKSGKLEIVPEEAEIVKMIFLYYLSGMGKLAIAKKLNEQQICTVRGCAWTTEDVRRTLRNEKYTGNLLLQKSFRENHITKKKVANIGQLPQS